MPKAYGAFLTLALISTTFQLTGSRLQAAEPVAPPMLEEESTSQSLPVEANSCITMCLADGEDPMDCEEDCIQVAWRTPLRPFKTACK